jgi:hypothetical protein
MAEILFTKIWGCTFPFGRSSSGFNRETFRIIRRQSLTSYLLMIRSLHKMLKHNAQRGGDVRSFIRQTDFRESW